MTPETYAAFGMVIKKLEELHELGKTITYDPPIPTPDEAWAEGVRDAIGAVELLRTVVMNAGLPPAGPPS